MKLSAKRPNALASWSSKVIKLLGLFLVVSIVWNVCQARLNVLKQDRAASMVGYVSAEDKLKQLDCLTRNIYWEAASEPFEGKVAVAQVTLNRVESGKFANTVCGVVYQKNVFYEKVVCQFSWFCEGNHKIRAVHKPMWQESELVAAAGHARQGRFHRSVPGREAAHTGALPFYSVFALRREAGWNS